MIHIVLQVFFSQWSTDFTFWKIKHEKYNTHITRLYNTLIEHMQHAIIKQEVHTTPFTACWYDMQIGKIKELKNGKCKVKEIKFCCKTIIKNTSGQASRDYIFTNLISRLTRLRKMPASGENRFAFSMPWVLCSRILSLKKTEKKNLKKENK